MTPERNVVLNPSTSLRINAVFGSKGYALCPMPYAQFPIPNSQFPIPNSQFPIRISVNSNEPYIPELTFDSPKQKVELPKRDEKLE